MQTGLHNGNRVLIRVCTMLFCVGATVVAAQQIQAEPRSQFRKEASRESVFAGAVPEVRQDVRHDVSPTVREMLALLDTNGISGVDTSSAETEREEMAKGTEKYATADPTRSVEEAREDKLIRHRSAVQSASTVQLETLAPVGTSSGLNFEGVSAALSGWAVPDTNGAVGTTRSEEHTSELQSHSFISYAVFCLKK